MRSVLQPHTYLVRVSALLTLDTPSFHFRYQIVLVIHDPLDTPPVLGGLSRLGDGAVKIGKSYLLIQPPHP